MHSLKGLLLIIFLFIWSWSISQNCGLLNPSFETYNTCPTNKSQLEHVNSWVMTLPLAVSTPDYFNYNCGFAEFNGAAGIDVQAAAENSYTNCGRVGIFLNYNDGIQSDRYKEFIGQDMDLINGVQYTMEIDLHKSNDNSTDDLERDFVIYGYNGVIPASHSNYCIVGATPLATISHASIGTSMQTHSVTFTPLSNFSHLILGPECSGVGAINTGYIFIDNVNLTSNDNNTLNPIITGYKFSEESICKCTFKDDKSSFYLKGTIPPSGATSTWGQSASNPEVVTFNNPASDSTTITGTGYLTPGSYQFTYTFSKGGCSISDTVNVDIVSPTLSSINAGADISICNGNNDFGALNTNRRIRMNASPSVAQINTNNYKTWWSMIRDNGSEWVFPNPCGIPYDGEDEGDVFVFNTTGQSSPINCGNISSYWSSAPDLFFNIRNPQDTITFIWHVIEPCGDTLVDTVMLFMNDVDLGPTLDITSCPGNDTILIQQYETSSYRRLFDNPNLSFSWSVSGGIPIALLDSSQIDSVYLVVPGNVSTNYDIRLDVTDITNGCSWYDITRVSITAVTSPIVDAGPDISICNGNNDGSILTTNRYISMNASPSVTQINTNNYSTWWSMIRDDGSEWVFPNPCGIPYDGLDEGDVFLYHMTGQDMFANCGNISSYWSSAPDVRFYFRNPQDTVMFIWHVSDPCSGTQMDTVMVYMNDVDLGFGLTHISCPGGNDTIFIEQHESSSFRRLKNNSNLNFTWSVVAGGTPISLLDTSKIDSIYLVIDGSINTFYDVRLSVTDLINGCTWYDEIRVIVNPRDSAVVDAGPSQTFCNTVLGNFQIDMAATPTLTQVNSNDYKTWWSVIRSDGSEWVFPNPCGIPYDGTNEGDVYTLNYSGATNPALCGNLTSVWPSSPNARFYLDSWRNYNFIWHVIDDCNPNDTLRDTVQINWGFSEPTVNAGPDQTPGAACNAIELQGNLSASTAGNTGCYLWRQVSGPDVLSFIDSTSNIAYVVNLDSVSPGVYQIEYNLGCFPCTKKDTLLLTINPGIVGGNLNVNTSWDGISPLCLRDSVFITASNSHTYGFYINDSLIKGFSTDSTLTILAPLDSLKLKVIGKDISGTCLSNSDSVFNILVIPCVYTDTVTECSGFYCVDTSEMKSGYDTLTTCSGSMITSMGGMVIINDTCVTHIPPSGPWMNDTICLTLCDTINNICDTTLLIFCNSDTLIDMYCNDTTVYLNIIGTATIDTSYVLDSLISINYPIDSVWLSNNLFNCSHLNLDSVTVFARNAFGVIDSCIAQINVLDTISPLISCLSPTVYLDASGNVTIDTSILLSFFNDNCGVDSVWTDLSTSTLTCSSVGGYTVTLYAKDVSNNIDSCIASLTIRDTIKPSISCLNDTLYLNSMGSLIIDTSGLISSYSDNCGVDSIWMDSNLTSLSCTDTGLYTIYIYIMDVNGNIDSCLSSLTILDTLKPTLICQDTSINLGITGTITIDTSFVIQTLVANCGIDSVWLSNNLFTCLDTGINNVTVYVSDYSNNIDSCSATVTVRNNISPNLLCSDTTIYLDTAGTAKLTASHVILSIVSNCSVDSIWLSDSLFYCHDVGVNQVIIYARSITGNIDSCIANVTVIDTINPILNCLNANFYVDSSGIITIDTTGLIANYADNCAVDSVWLNSDDTTFNCAQIGLNMITIYVKDINNNLDSCQSTINIIDTISPNISCNSGSSFILGPLGQILIDTTGLVGSFSDNCGVDSLWLRFSDTLLTCADVGTKNVRLYILDNSGNIDSCDASVNIIDTSSTIICKSDTIRIDSSGVIFIDTTGLISRYSICGVDSIWLSPSDTILTCTDTGWRSVTIYVIDNNSNLDSCVSNIYVDGIHLPFAVCQDTSIYLNSSGYYTIDSSYIDGGSYGICTNLSQMIISQNQFNCSDSGINLVTLTVVDNNSNISQCVSQVTVLDSITPQIFNCSYDTSYNFIGTCDFIVPDFIGNINYTDNCDSSSVTISQIPAAGSVIDIDSSGLSNILQEVLVIATDAYNNSDTCSIEIDLTCTLDLLIPQFISPNGDGINDEWFITGLEYYPNNNVKIFNRWGQVVYTMSKYDNNWSGQTNEGNPLEYANSDKKLPSGTYFWILDQGDNFGVRTGYVHLKK